MYSFVNSKRFTYSWFLFSFLMLFITSISSYSGLTLLFALTLLDGVSDIFLEHFYSLGISRGLTFYNCLANLLGIVVQFAYGLYGGMVTSFIGLLLLSHKTLTWDSRKDGKITRYKRQEFTLLSLGILAGIVSLGVLYGYIFRGDYPLWLISLNVLVFILGTTGRILLINGKSLAQYIYVVREFVELEIFISMLALGLATGSFWIRLASILSSMIILLKGVVNWSYEARNQDM